LSESNFLIFRPSPYKHVQYLYSIALWICADQQPVSFRLFKTILTYWFKT
jgi:hypothetical protein